jgi:hypothetical protein
MSEARALIAAFHELNRTDDRRVGHFTPSLAGMFGSKSMLGLFLDELDAALVSGKLAEPLRTRATNLVHTFLPQVAGYNGITDLADLDVTAEQLRAVRADSPQNRLQGVRVILAGFMKVLEEVIEIT